jgi:hypothetical protein
VSKAGTLMGTVMVYETDKKWVRELGNCWLGVLYNKTECGDELSKK